MNDVARMARDGVIKDGPTQLRALRDGRDIRLNGERIADPTRHAAFRNACETSASFYDFQARPENRDLMTFETNAIVTSAPSGQDDHQMIERQVDD